MSERRKQHNEQPGPGHYTDGTPRLTPRQIDKLLEDFNVPAYGPAYLLRVAEQLKREPDDADLTAYFLDALAECPAVAAKGSDPFLPNYPPRGAVTPGPDDLTLVMLPTGELFGIPGQAPRQNIVIAGATGSGKSTLVRAIIRQLVQRGWVVVYFDRKRDFRGLLADPELAPHTVVLDAAQLQLSLYQPIPGVPRRISAPATTELIARTTGRMYAQWLLHNCVHELLKAQDRPSGLPLQTLILWMEAMPIRGWRQNELRHSNLLALSHINNHLGPTFAYANTDFLERLFERPGLYIIEVATLPADLHGLLTSLMTQWLYLRRTHQPREEGRPRVVFCLDDATVAVDAQMDRQSAGGTAALTEQAFMGRSAGIGFIFGVHSLSSASRKLLINCQTRLVMAMQGEDSWVLQNALGATREQAAFVRALQPGQAVVLAPSSWPHPVVGLFPDDPLPQVDPEQCRASVERFLARVTSERFEPEPAPSPASNRAARSHSGERMQLTDDDRRALLPLSEPVPPPVTSLYERLGIDRRRGRSLMGRLERAGVVRLHRCPTSGRGARITVGELTEAGWQQLESAGMAKRPDRRTRGGFLHEVAAAALPVLAGREGASVDFEVDLGPVRVDARWRYPDGRLVYFQIGLSDDQREIDALRRARSVPAVAGNRLVLVARTRDFAERVLKQVGPAPNLDWRFVGDLIRTVHR